VSLTPMDIHNKEFKKGFRGYREAEVDDFLDSVVREFEGLLKEIASLREQLRKTEEQLGHYRNIEETMNRAMVAAQRTAEEIRESSRREAALVLKEAEGRAAEVVAGVERQAEKARRDLEEAVRQASFFRTKLRAILQAQMDTLNAGDGVLPPDPGPGVPDGEV
jgi:cell division initiation protein